MEECLHALRVRIISHHDTRRLDEPRRPAIVVIVVVFAVGAGVGGVGVFIGVCGGHGLEELHGLRAWRRAHVQAARACG